MMKKKFLLLFFSAFCLFFCQSAAAQNIDTFLQKYLKGDTVQAKSSIVRLYKVSDRQRKRLILDDISSKLKNELENGRREAALPLSTLYLSLSNELDEQNPVMYFVAGEAYAKQEDTTHLKECIERMVSFADKTGADLTAITNKLNDYLNRYRNSTPTLESLEGYWVADIIEDDEGSPQLVMRIHKEREDSVSVEILPYCYFSYEMAKHLRKSARSGDSYSSGLVKTFSTDSLYIIWSSKRVVNKDDFAVDLLRSVTSEAASTVTGIFSQRNKYSFEEMLTARALTGIAEIGVNILLDELFMPRSRDFLLEARLRIQNSRQITGTFYYSTFVTRGDGRSRSSTDDFEIQFIHWDSLSNIAFALDRDPEVPDRMDDDVFEDDTTAEFGQAFSMRRCRADNFQYYYNQLQLGRLRHYNDSLLHARGIKETGLVDEDKLADEAVNYWGFSTIENDSTVQRKFFLRTSEGLMVESIDIGSPAYVTPLHRGDVILAVDGRPVKTEEELKGIMDENTRKTCFTVLRGDKRTNIYIQPINSLYYIEED